MTHKIIGYQKAKDFMLKGAHVLEVPQFRGAHIPYLKVDGVTSEYRIRSDSWDKLRLECRLVEKQYHGKRCQHVNYLWAYVGKEA